MGNLIRKRFRVENEITLFHGDCLKLLSRIPDGAAQLVITSPPYNIGKPYEVRQRLDAYLRFQDAVIPECARIVRDGGSICWQVGNHINGHGQVIPLDILLHPLFAKHEGTHCLRLRNRIVWHFEHGLHCSRRFSGRHETILWYTKGDDYIFNLDAVRIPQKYPGKRAYKGPRRGEPSCNPLGKNPGDVWILPNVKHNHVEKTAHPCQFPVELAERLILAFSRVGDLVVDPFVGVGSTAVAGVIHGRRVAGADIVHHYLELAESRLGLAAKGRLRVRPRTRPVYEPPEGIALTIPIAGLTAAQPRVIGVMAQNG